MKRYTDPVKHTIEAALHASWPRTGFHVRERKQGYEVRWHGKSPDLGEVETTLERAGVSCDVTSMGWNTDLGIGL